MILDHIPDEAMTRAVVALIEASAGHPFLELIPRPPKGVGAPVPGSREYLFEMDRTRVVEVSVEYAHLPQLVDKVEEQLEQLAPEMREAFRRHVADVEREAWELTGSIRSQAVLRSLR